MEDASSIVEGTQSWKPCLAAACEEQAPSAIIPPVYHPTVEASTPTAGPRSDTTIRTYVWSDKLLDCFAYGPCHATVGLTMVLPLCTYTQTHVPSSYIVIFSTVHSQLQPSNLVASTVAIGQVMVRLQTVGWAVLPFGRPQDAFRVAIVLTMFWITVNCLIYYLAIISSVLKLILFSSVNATIYVYFVINVIRVRWHVRKRYNIVTTKRSDYSIGGCAPHLCTMQLLRHTGDYDTYNAQWFTATGLPAHVQHNLPPVRDKQIPGGDQGSIMSNAGNNNNNDATIVSLEEDEPFQQYYLQM